MTHERAVKLVQDAIQEEEGISPDKYDLECTLDSLKIDSIDTVQVCLNIEDHFKFSGEIKDVQLSSVKTIGDLVSIVEAYD